MKKISIETFGWLGTVAIVGAYAVNSFGILTTHSFIYQFLNIFGSLGIIAVSMYKRVYQTVALNTIWLLIAVIAVSRLFL